MRFLTGRTWLDDPQPGPEHRTRDAGTGPKTGRVDPHMGPPPRIPKEIWRERRKLTRDFHV